jgi:hypothetical protein
VILNAYAILDGFVALLRLGLAAAVVLLAVATWRRWRRLSAADRPAVEDRYYLVFLLAGLLLGLNAMAWPLFYLLLQSYVPEWPGVMCIYGVTRIGAGTVGPARHLPALVTTLQATKPLVVFLSGAWFALHLVNRRTRTAPLTGHVLVGVLAAGVASLADAAAELAYLVIPKKEEFLSSGCCTTESDPNRFDPARLLEPAAEPWLTGAYFALNVLAPVALFAAARVARRRVPTGWLGPLLAAAVANLVVGAVFLTEVAAPRLLDLPDHHCPYDLVERAPGAVVAVGLFLAGTLGVGWGCVAGWVGREPEAAARRSVVGGAFRLAALAYAGSVALLAAALALARADGG